MRFMPSRLPLLAVAVLLLTGAAGPVTCSQMLKDDLATARAIAADLGRGAAVGAARLQAGLDDLCARGEKNAANAAQLNALLAAGGAGPKTARNTGVVNSGLKVLNNVCNAAPAATRTSTLTAYFKEAMAVANSIEAALAQAKAAAASGS